MKKIIWFIFILFSSNLFSSSGIIVSNRKVEIKEKKISSSKTKFKLKTGSKVTIIDKTKNRAKYYKKAFGYHWYKIKKGKNEGWVWGKYLYLIKEKQIFLKKDFKNKINFFKTPFFFNVAIEPSYPVMDKNGLTGSTIHGFPFFYKKNNKVFSIKVDSRKAKIIFREPKNRFYWLKLISNEGVGEKVKSIQVKKVKNIKIIELIIQFVSQEGGGIYKLTLLKKKNYFLVYQYKFLKGKPY